MRVFASDAETAHTIVQAECRNNQCHCPPEWCTDDIQTDISGVREIAATTGDGTAAPLAHVAAKHIVRLD
jgi:hypothetical protein